MAAASPSPEETAAWQKRLAAQANNRAWRLSESPSRSPAESEEMLHAAHAAMHLWSIVGTEDHKAHAAQLLAHVHALLGDADQAGRYLAACAPYLCSPQREALRGADSRVAVNASRRFPIPVRVPPSSSVRMRSARRELVRLLDGWPGGRRVQPSLALIERALDRHRGAGLDQVSPCVLAHAAVSLDLLDP